MYCEIQFVHNKSTAQRGDFSDEFNVKIVDKNFADNSWLWK